MSALSRAVWRVVREVAIAMLIAVAGELGRRRKRPKSEPDPRD